LRLRRQRGGGSGLFGIKRYSKSPSSTEIGRAGLAQDRDCRACPAGLQPL